MFRIQKNEINANIQRQIQLAAFFISSGGGSSCIYLRSLAGYTPISGFVAFQCL